MCECLSVPLFGFVCVCLSFLYVRMYVSVMAVCVCGIRLSDTITLIGSALSLPRGIKIFS